MALEGSGVYIAVSLAGSGKLTKTYMDVGNTEVIQKRAPEELTVQGQSEAFSRGGPQPPET